MLPAKPSSMIEIRLAAAALALALSLGSASATAQAGADAMPPPRSPAAAPPPGQPPATIPPPSRLFYPPNWIEWWLQLTTRVDWSYTPQASIGLTTDLSLVLDPERRGRLGGYVGMQLGDWGDGERGLATPELGLVVRGSFLMDELFDGFVVGRTGFVFGMLEEGPVDHHVAMRASLGAGLRVARFVSLELTYDQAMTLDERFQRGSGTSLYTRGTTLSAGLDLCFVAGCRDEEVEPEPRDRTAEIYQAAADLKVAPAQRLQLCAAVAAALDADRYHPVWGEDGIEAFLLGIVKELRLRKQHDLARKVDKQLVQLHQKLRSSRVVSQAWGRHQAREGRRLKHPVRYAPVAVELRDNLGCDPPTGSG